MSYIFRQSKHTRWHHIHEKLPWLDENEIPADPLGDFVAGDNQISVYVIEDDLSNLDRLIAAMAANRQNLANYDYVLFSPEILEQADITIKKTNGLLSDDEANRWHLSLINLSATKVIKLVTYIWLSPLTETKRVLPNKLKDLIAQSVNSEFIPYDQVGKNIRPQIDSLVNRS